MRVLVCATLLLCSLVVQGHDREVHGLAGGVLAGTVPTLARPMADGAADGPRLALSNGRIELVAARIGEQLVFYVDDFATNTPLDGLRVELTAGSLQLLATPAGVGRYVVPTGLFDPSVPRPLNLRIRGPSGLHPPTQLDEHLQAELPAGIGMPAAAVAPVLTAERLWPWVLGLPVAFGLLLPLQLWRWQRRG